MTAAKGSVVWDEVVGCQPHESRWWMRHTLDQLWCQPYVQANGSPGWTDGYRVVRFIESVCRQTRGRHAGDRVVLFPWQVQIVLEVFATDEDGYRLYRRGLLGMPRKNGKSMLGAGIALYLLIADNEATAEVYSCAGDREQARIVFREAMRMVQLEPLLSAELVIRESTSTIYHPASNSTYRALSAEAYTKEGLNPSGVIFDEVHVQPNWGLWDVMTQGSAARERALVLGITTAGYNKATVCGELYDLGRADARYVDGAWVGGTDGYYFRWYEPQDAACDYRSAAVWRECNPGLVSGFLLERDFAVALSSGTKENAFRRYRLNQWTTSVEAWMPFGTWDGQASSRRLQPHEECVLGFDGSFSNDSTGIVACTRDGFEQVIGVWERPRELNVDNVWQVPIADVERTIVDACKQYTVREVACDPFRWQRSMQALADAGVPVVEWPTTSPARMVPATQAFYEAVVTTRALTHDGSEALARHVGNAKLKTDRLGPRIVKEHKYSPNKIDLAVAAVIAYDRARQMPVPSRGPTIW